jgi:1-deoxy-D-xylulose-5-phosphate reductoisomerase
MSPGQPGLTPTGPRPRYDARVRAQARPGPALADNGSVESAEPATHGRPREVVILGSTGSIGIQALDIIRRNPDRFRVVALAAGGADPDALARQAAEFGVAAVAVASQAAAPQVQAALRHHFDLARTTGGARSSDTSLPPGRGGKGGLGGRAVPPRAGGSRGVAPPGLALPALLAGPDAVGEVAAWPCDVVLNGVTGAAGLPATLAALDAGRVLALANKESLITGGPLVTSRAKPGQIVPVDSEHSTIAQCLRAGRHSEVRRLVLTASGGPFRGWSRDRLDGVTPQQALAHPTWNMGPLVTVNSATLVNKGLEVIEAHLLFGFGLDRIDVVVHPQSIVHSMVEFSDGATIIQASPPDMRLPISLGLAWPDRVADAAPGLDWSAAAAWTFEPLDDAAFPAVALAREAAAAGGTAPAVYNAANEACVADFLAERIPFPRIVDTVARIVSEHDVARAAVTTVADVLAVDDWARRRARELNTEGGFAG